MLHMTLVSHQDSELNTSVCASQKDEMVIEGRQGAHTFQLLEKTLPIEHVWRLWQPPSQSPFVSQSNLNIGIKVL